MHEKSRYPHVIFEIMLIYYMCSTGIDNVLMECPHSTYYDFKSYKSVRSQKRCLIQIWSELKAPCQTHNVSWINLFPQRLQLVNIISIYIL